MPATNYGTTVRPAFSRVRGQLQQRGDLSREAVGGDRDGPLPLLAFEQPMPPLASGHEQGTQQDGDCSTSPTRGR
jgi:hypothetical protein